MRTPLSIWRDRPAAFLAAIFKGAWYIECDQCGATLKTGRRTRWFLTRARADQAGRDAGWQVGADGDAEICPACLAALDLTVYRTELCRSISGQWSLYRDGELTGRTAVNRTTDPATAREWASAVLSRPVEWLNGRYEPDDESGYWVADPQDSPAGES